MQTQLMKCVICNRPSGKPYRAPDPPPLPKVCVEESQPFTVTGLGPYIYVKDTGGERKVYICLFTCTCTRAVILEIVSDLSVDACLLTFQ